MIESSMRATGAAGASGATGGGASACWRRVSLVVVLGWSAALTMALAAPAARATALRDLAHVEGVRENQLIGYGLVVGLANTGDGQQIRYTGQSVANLLKQFGLSMPEGIRLRARNAAAVMVSASFPPGYTRGQKIDVTVSSVGDAKSLRGGTLLLTPLRGADGEVYALAQGSVVVPGVSAQGRSGTSVTVNATAAGRVPQGATIERAIDTDFDMRPYVRLSLTRPSFETASNVVKAIGRALGPGLATSRDATSVDVVAPTDPTARVAFMARLDAIDVATGKPRPRVVFNSRTGTVVVSEGVTVSPAAVSHGALKVTIREGAVISQPGPFSSGQTVVAPESDVEIEPASGRMFEWPAGTKLQTIVDTVNAIGAGPDDVMAILQALDQAGALNGELIVI